MASFLINSEKEPILELNNDLQRSFISQKSKLRLTEGKRLSDLSESHSQKPGSCDLRQSAVEEAVYHSRSVPTVALQGRLLSIN